MNIFILEDEIERLNFFKRLYRQHKLYFSYDVEESLKILNQIEFAVIFLDHDIQEEKLTTKNNGYELVKKIIELKLQKQAVIYVHSMNPCRGQLMSNTLKESGYEAQWIPFYLLKQGDR